MTTKPDDENGGSDGFFKKHGSPILVAGIPTGTILAMALFFQQNIPSHETVKTIADSVVALQNEVRSATKELTRAVTIVDRISANGHPTREEFNAQSNAIGRLEARVQTLIEGQANNTGRIAALERK